MKKLLWTFTALFVPSLVTSLPCFAQTQQDVAPVVEVGILRQKEVEQGGRTVTLNLVTPPPNLAPARPPIEPQVEANPLSEQELQVLQEQAQKPIKSLIVEGTTFANGITDFRWHDGTGSHRAFSNVDFTVFSAMTFLETEDTAYQFMFLVSQTAGELPAEAPSPNQFSTERAEYLAVSESEELQGENLFGAFVATAYSQGGTQDVAAANIDSAVRHSLPSCESAENRIQSTHRLFSRHFDSSSHDEPIHPPAG